MGNRHHYFFSIDDLAGARGPVPELSYDGAGPNDFAAALQEALRSPILFERWKALQEDPDSVDAALRTTDSGATATARVSDLRIDLELLTELPMSIVRHRMNLLIGNAWQLRDMRSA